MEKMPPIAKIYEAYTCIADHRIELKDSQAIVTSSDHKKTYTIKWKDDDYASTDNASFWQGYPGYPIIAVLMLQKKLSYKEEIVKLFSNINWHELNEKHKRNYSAAIDEVLITIDYDKETIIKETNKIYKELENLTINVKKKIESN